MAKRSNRVRVGMVRVGAIRWTLGYNGGMVNIWPNIPTVTCEVTREH